ncbi:MAG: hypothetical protein KJ594_04310, partial [Candidatus Omnitrophica bacterium]|nr:hypothetical protein [Candidatus Omnitrophota bacterium]
RSDEIKKRTNLATTTINADLKILLKNDYIIVIGRIVRPTPKLIKKLEKLDGLMNEYVKIGKFTDTVERIPNIVEFKHAASFNISKNGNGHTLKDGGSKIRVPLNIKEIDLQVKKSIGGLADARDIAVVTFLGKEGILNAQDIGITIKGKRHLLLLLRFSDGKAWIIDSFGVPLDYMDKLLEIFQEEPQGAIYNKDFIPVGDEFWRTNGALAFNEIYLKVEGEFKTISELACGYFIQTQDKNKLDRGVKGVFSHFDSGGVYVYHENKSKPDFYHAIRNISIEETGLISKSCVVFRDFSNVKISAGMPRLVMLLARHIDYLQPFMTEARYSLLNNTDMFIVGPENRARYYRLKEMSKGRRILESIFFLTKGEHILFVADMEALEKSLQKLYEIVEIEDTHGLLEKDGGEISLLAGVQLLLRRIDGKISRDRSEDREINKVIGRLAEIIRSDYGFAKRVDEALEGGINVSGFDNDMGKFTGRHFYKMIRYFADKLGYTDNANKQWLEVLDDIKVRNAILMLYRYGWQLKNDGRLDATVEFIIKRNEQIKNVMDIGISAAWYFDIKRLIAAFRKMVEAVNKVNKYITFYGVDIRIDLDVEKILLPNAIYVEQNITKPFPDEYRGKFDVVRLSAVFLHLAEENKQIAIRSLAGLLRENGWLLCMEPLEKEVYQKINGRLVYLGNLDIEMPGEILPASDDYIPALAKYTEKAFYKIHIDPAIFELISENHYLKFISEFNEILQSLSGGSIFIKDVGCFKTRWGQKGDMFIAVSPYGKYTSIPALREFDHGPFVLFHMATIAEDPLGDKYLYIDLSQTELLRKNGNGKYIVPATQRKYYTSGKTEAIKYSRDILEKAAKKLQERGHNLKGIIFIHWDTLIATRSLLRSFKNSQYARHLYLEEIAGYENKEIKLTFLWHSKDDS